MPSELLSQLELAYDRFLHFIDVTCNGFPISVISSDRKKYPDMYKRSQGNSRPILIDKDCVSFMSETYHLPELLCQMYITNDFNWTAASGFTPNGKKDIADSCAELKQFIIDDESFSDTIGFLIEREFLSSKKGCI
jgi:hypothetical protein